MHKIRLFLLMCFLGFATKASQAQEQEYVFNGSLEYGLNINWTHTVKPEASATTKLNRGTAKDGNAELEVNLQNRLNDKYAVKSTTTAKVGSDSIYVLRFWAHESKEFRYEGNPIDATPDFAQLIVTITGESGHKHEVLFFLRQGYTTFHLPFKTNDKELTISFYPQTEGRSYYIDGVEVLDQTHHNDMDVYNTYVWNNKRSTSGATWLAGDNDIAYELPDGRTLWVFNDSFISANDGDVNDTTRNDLVRVGRFVRNAAVVEDVSGNLTDLGATDKNNNGQAAFFETIQEILDGNQQKNFYWVGDMVMESNQIKVYLVELDETGGLHDTGKSYLASVSYPELQLVDIKEQASFAFGYETSFVENDTIYLFKKNGGTFVARTPVGNYIGDEMWEFWNGSTWVEDPSAAVPTRSGRDQAEDVIKLEDNSYALVSGLGVFSRDIKLEFSQTPQGPWTNPIVVYSRPDDWRYWAYLPNFQKQLKNGNYSISYSSNAFLPLFFSSWSFVDKYWYRQRHVQVDVYGLSPYSEGYDCAGVQGGSAYRDKCDVCVGGTTGLQPCLFGVALLYSDCEFAGTAVGLEVGNYNRADLQAMGLEEDILSSLKVEEGYVVELYAGDKLHGNSTIIKNDIACLKTVKFDNKVTSLVVRRKGVDDMAGTYVLRNKLTNLVMDTENGSTTMGTNIVQTESDSSATQHFKFDYIGNGYYTIRNAGAGQLLNIANNSTELAAVVNLTSGSDITDLGGTLSSQYNDSPPNEGIDKLTDNNSATKFLTFNSKAWVQFHSPQPHVISAYSLTSANDADLRDPLNWTLSASNDSATWTVLDQMTGQDFPERFQEITFSIDNNSTAYSYYRLEMEANFGTLLQLAEWKLFVKPAEDLILESQQFVVQPAENGYFKIFNKNSDLLLEVLSDDENLSETPIRQLIDLGQESALWEFMEVPDSLIRDCAGVTGGTAFKDKCNNCVGGTTGLKPCKDDEPIRSLIYPNPTESDISLQIGDEWMGKPVYIYNFFGKKVWDGVFDNRTINVAHLPDGVYLLKVINGSSFTGGIFIKK